MCDAAWPYALAGCTRIASEPAKSTTATTTRKPPRTSAHPLRRPLQPPWSPDPRVCREASQELILQPAGAVAARGGCKGPNKVGLTSDPRMERR